MNLPGKFEAADRSTMEEEDAARRGWRFFCVWFYKDSASHGAGREECSGEFFDVLLKPVMALTDFPEIIRNNYELHEWRYASAVLRTDFREQWDDIVAVLSAFRLSKSHIAVSGGGKSNGYENCNRRS